MMSGLLWYDNGKDTLAEKIKVAAKRYLEKYGVRPDTCFVNPADAPDADSLNGIQIKTKPTIMPNYVWIGCAEKVKTKQSSQQN